MLHNAFAYVTRKFFKSIVIFLIILLMASLSLVGLSIKGATAKASQETFKNITNSFSMQINRRVNQGTPRGAGNIKGEDIKKITLEDFVTGKGEDAVNVIDSIVENQSVMVDDISGATNSSRIIKLAVIDALEQPADSADKAE